MFILCKIGIHIKTKICMEYHKVPVNLGGYFTHNLEYKICTICGKILERR